MTAGIRPHGPSADRLPLSGTPKTVGKPICRHPTKIGFHQKIYFHAINAFIVGFREIKIVFFEKIDVFRCK